MMFCPSCRSEHLGPVPCGLTFADRLRTVQVSERGFDTNERKNYYDRDAVRAAFGDDARDAYLEETRGLGAVQTASDGSLWVYDDPRTGEMRPLEGSDIKGGYLRGRPTEPDVEDAHLF